MVQKGPSASVSPVTSTSIGISPKIYLTFIFNTFAKLVSNLTAIPSASPKLLILNQEHTSKKIVFLWSNSYKIGIMIASLIEMVELPHFGQMTTSTI